jgi:hypothetical protein
LHTGTTQAAIGNFADVGNGPTTDALIQ